MKILNAWWHTQSSVAVVFESNLSRIPKLFLETSSGLIPLKSRIATQREFADYSSYYIDSKGVHFLLNSHNFYNVVTHSSVEYYLCGNFNSWGDAIGKSEWKMKRIAGDEASFELVVPLEKFAHIGKRKFLFKFASSSGVWLHPRSDAPNIEFDSNSNANLRFIARRSYKHFVIAQSEYTYDLREPTFLFLQDTNERIPIQAAQLLLQSYYSEKMGVEIFSDSTKFTLFAPRADSVSLLIRESVGSEPREISMSSKDGALWQKVVPENLKGKFYSYKIFGRNLSDSTAFNSEREVIDPYAKLLYKNTGQALIIDEKSLPKASRHFIPPSWQDLLIVETHLRDLLANAPQNFLDRERLSFKGLAKWLRTGDCYLEKLGANCVELQPVQEFDNANFDDYHWGYMPVNWFAPSSAYASDPEKLTQASDFADLIDAFHERKLAVILDVVYNHVGEPNHLIAIDKQYYFNTTSNDALTNFSGCGNDFRADVPMSKKLIIDSLKFLVKNYKIDGFRFDLAELLGVNVLSEIEVELKKINPSIILIAEPWSFRGNISHPLRSTGFSYWNDGFREFMLNYAKNAGDKNGFKYFISGSCSYASFPAQTVNYLESHDDMCLYDRICSNFDSPSSENVKIYKMCLALILTSVGIPMLAEGADLLRTKRGVSNTYLRGDLNALDYLRGEIFTGVRDWVRNFCKFRTSRASGALKLYDAPNSSYFKFFDDEFSNASSVLFNADKSLKERRIFAAFNPSSNFAKINLSKLDLKNFKMIADIDRFDVNGLYFSNFKDGILQLAPLSFALFLER